MIEAHHPSEPKPAPDHGALVAAASWFVTHRKQIESDIRSAHSGRGNAAAQWMTEDDNDFRGELRLTFDRLADALASAPSGEGGDHVPDAGKMIDQFAENAKCSELAAENARLREALTKAQTIAKAHCTGSTMDRLRSGLLDVLDVFRAALAPTDGGTK